MEFIDDAHKLIHMKKVIARYRIFIMKFLNITKTELIYELSKRMNKSERSLHLRNINTLQESYDVVEVLKDWKLEMTGSRRLPDKVNPRDYAKKLQGEFKMKVVEIFNSIDGEGKRAGELTTFIRLFGCNLRCGFCDTKYSYEQQGLDQPWKEMSIQEIIQECEKYNTNNITLTGGEPLIHLDVKYLLRALSENGYNVNVETNGSVSIKQYYNEDGSHASGYENVWFTIDYKSPSSKMEDKMIMDNFDIKKYKYQDVVYKFVVGNDSDLNRAYTIITDMIDSGEYLNNSVYLSPIFNEIEAKDIVEFMQRENLFSKTTPIKCQLQLHKYIWPVNQRGV